MTTILLAPEDELASGVVRTLLDRFVPEFTETLWLKELWTDQLETARTYEELPRGRHLRVPSTLSGRAKDLFRAFHLALAEKERRDEDVALVFAHDTDRDDSARGSLDQIRGMHDGVLKTVLAEPTPEFDGWILLGHEPTTSAENAALANAIAQLEFDPRHKVLKLNSTTTNERDAKRVCRELLLLEHQARPDDPAVQKALGADHAVLLRYASGTGLPEFLDDIRLELLPLLEGSRG